MAYMYVQDILCYTWCTSTRQSEHASVKPICAAMQCLICPCKEHPDSAIIMPQQSVCELRWQELRLKPLLLAIEGGGAFQWCVDTHKFEGRCEGRSLHRFSSRRKPDFVISFRRYLPGMRCLRLLHKRLLSFSCSWLLHKSQFVSNRCRAHDTCRQTQNTKLLITWFQASGDLVHRMVFLAGTHTSTSFTSTGQRTRSRLSTQWTTRANARQKTETTSTSDCSR